MRISKIKGTIVTSRVLPNNVLPNLDGAYELSLNSLINPNPIQV